MSIEQKYIYISAAVTSIGCVLMTPFALGTFDPFFLLLYLLWTVPIITTHFLVQLLAAFINGKFIKISLPFLTIGNIFLVASLFSETTMVGKFSLISISCSIIGSTINLIKFQTNKEKSSKTLLIITFLLLSIFVTYHVVTSRLQKTNASNSVNTALKEAEDFVSTHKKLTDKRSKIKGYFPTSYRVDKDGYPILIPVYLDGTDEYAIVKVSGKSKFKLVLSCILTKTDFDNNHKCP